MVFWLDDAAAQTPGSCEAGSAEGVLRANNVRAAIYNNGNLFWKGGDPLYRVGGANAIFTTGFWIGGLIDGDLRFAGTQYGPFDFHAGPLTNDGELPDPHDCSAYDRIYRITALDLARLDSTGEATDDVRDWPWQVGAPVRDGDGNPDNYDLSAGDRPEISGHEMLWWVTNDVGGSDGWSQTLPLGVEIQTSAFAVSSTEPALQNTTFYRYTIVNRQSHRIDSVHIGWMVDADIGDFGDDHVGSDTTLGMGFFYNGDNNDEGDDGYGIDPPALGVDFVQGPLADTDGEDNDRDGAVDEAGERRGLSVLLAYQNDATPMGNPETAADAFNYLRGIWRDGRPLTFGAWGYGGDLPTSFMYPGDPVTGSFWSEVNPDIHRPYLGDRKFVASTGPIHLEPGTSEEIVIAVVWARGADHLDSITELRKADRIVQETWSAGTIGRTDIPSAPAAGPTLASPAGGVSGQPLNLTISWKRQEFMSEYEIEIATTPDFSGRSHQILSSNETSVDIDSLQPFTEYFWRVRGRSPLVASPPSETRRFRTSDVRLATLGLQTIPGTLDPAFVEVRGPGGIDPCGPEAESTDGCAETGGNLVHGSKNSTGEYIMYHLGNGSEQVIGRYAPNDFEIRFTAEGSYAYHVFSRDVVIWVPFEVWDVGDVGFFNENDPLDDVQLIPILFSDGGGKCEFAYGEGDDHFGLGWKTSDRIYAYYAVDDYDGWKNAVGPLVEATSDRCYELPDPSSTEYHELIDLDRGRPLQRVIFSGDPAAGNAPGEGTIVRFYTTPPPIQSPIPAAPASGTGPFEQPLELIWNAPPGSATSQLQISAGPAFENPVFDATTEDEAFIISGLKEGVTYLWRVRLNDPAGPWSDVWTFTAGEVTNVSAETPAELPSELTLNQNYPNPFNPSTTIRFGLPDAQTVKLVVYDLLGRRIATLTDGTMPAGWHELSWNASNYASGIYMYTIEAEGQRRTETMVLLR